jgi:preprotein translocase subunit SecA
MTATAASATAEFKHFYGLDLVAVSPTAPDKRIERPDLWYGSVESKVPELVKFAVTRHQTGQPVVIGVWSDEECEQVSRQLTQRGVGHAVARADDTGEKARVMAEAGRLNAVTIIVDSAGRGYGISLGGDIQYAALGELGFHVTEDSNWNHRIALDELREARCVATNVTAANRARVIAVGGLLALGISRSASVRADDWLRGLSGQRGEPGECGFYLSNEEYVTDFERPMLRNDAVRYRSPWVISRSPFSWFLRNAIKDSYRRSEAHAFAEHRRLAVLDDEIDRQRSVVYEVRRCIYESADIADVTKRLASEAGQEQAGGDGSQGMRRRPRERISESKRCAQTNDGSPISAQAAHKDDSRAQESGSGSVTDRIRATLSAIDLRWQDHLSNVNEIYSHITSDKIQKSDVGGKFLTEAREAFRNAVCLMIVDIEGLNGIAPPTCISPDPT